MPKKKSKRLHGLGMLRVFTDSPPHRQALVLGCLILGTLAETVGLATLLPLLSIATGDATAAASPVQRTIVSAIQSVGLAPTLEVLVLVIVAGMALRAVLSLMATSQVGYAVSEVTTHMRQLLIEALLQVRWSYFARQPVGRFGNSISGEAARAADAYLSAATLIVSTFQVVVFCSIAFLMSWKMAAVSLLVGGLLIVSFNGFIRQARRAGQQQTKRSKRLAGRLTDALISIKPLKSMARHHQFGKLFSAEVRELNDAMRAQVFAKQAVRSLQDPVLGVFLAVGFYLAITYDQIPMSQLLVMGLFMGKTVDTIGKVQMAYQALATAESAYSSIRGTIDEAQAERETWSGTRTPTLNEGCTFTNVSFAFASKTVLRDVSLVIPAGRITTLTGTSGGGKTTIADLLLGLYRPNLGEIRVDGVPLGEIDLGKWRRMVGYVPQEVILFHDTVFNNVALGEPGLTREDVQVALEAAGIWEFVAGQPGGIDSLVGERGTLMSGGQRQRIAVARALVHRPSLLILDEATSALDPETEAAICRNITAFSGARGLTILAISHQPSWVEAADRVYQVAHNTAVLVRDDAAQARA
jgi:ATP-binding cassette subfamily C protein